MRNCHVSPSFPLGIFIFPYVSLESLHFPIFPFLASLPYLSGSPAGIPAGLFLRWSLESETTKDALGKRGLTTETALAKGSLESHSCLRGLKMGGFPRVPFLDCFFSLNGFLMGWSWCGGYGRVYKLLLACIVDDRRVHLLLAPRGCVAS